jgi:flagellar biosynthesis protein FliQ
MIPVNDLFELAKEGMLLSILLCLPIAGGVFVTSLIFAILQMFTRVSEPAISQIARIVGGAAALIVAAPWIASRAVHFAERVWSLVQAIHP